MEGKAALICREQEIFGVGLNKGKAVYLISDLMKIKSDLYKEIRPYLTYVVDIKEIKNKVKRIVKVQGWPDYILGDGELNFVKKLTLANGEPTKSVSNFGNPREIGGPFSRISMEEPTIASRKQITKRLLEMGWKPRLFTDPTPKYPKGNPKMTVEGEPVDTLARVGPFGEALANWYTANHRQSQIVGFLKRLREDGRITPGCNPCGTNTTRAKHRGVANIPRTTSWYGPEMRSLFCTLTKSLRLVGADLSGLELRCLAHRMNDPHYIDLVLHGDIHTYNMEMAGLSTRDQAKTFIYAFLYGAGNAKIGDIIGGSAKDGKELKSMFLNRIPSLARLIKNVQKFSERGWLPGLDKRKIYVRSYEGRVLTHTSLNTLLQSDGAIVAKRSMVVSHEEISRRELPANQVIYYHDEFQWEVEKGYCDEVGSILVESMEDTGRHYNMRIPITGDYKVGRSWADTH